MLIAVGGALVALSWLHLAILTWNPLGATDFDVARRHWNEPYETAIWLSVGLLLGMVGAAFLLRRHPIYRVRVLAGALAVMLAIQVIAVFEVRKNREPQARVRTSLAELSAPTGDVLLFDRYRRFGSFTNPSLTQFWSRPGATPPEECAQERLRLEAWSGADPGPSENVFRPEVCRWRVHRGRDILDVVVGTGQYAEAGNGRGSISLQPISPDPGTVVIGYELDPG